VELPKALIDQVREGRVVLFLGSGASIGARHPRNQVPPLGGQLQKLIAEKFLGPTFVGRPLDQTARLAVSETSLMKVQDYVSEVFKEFGPGAAHSLIPKFVWHSIFTTNYDLIVERAYESASRVQDLVPFISDAQMVDDLLRTTRSVPYIKLHGCITSTSDERAPLILTPEQYITHESGRRRLFMRFEEAAREHPIVYVGYSLSDIDLLQILHRLQVLGDLLPRSFIVAPNISEPDKRYWDTRRISPLPGTLQEFLAALDSQVEPCFRAIATLSKAGHPILKHAHKGLAEGLSSGLQFLLSKVLDYVHAGLACDPPDPLAFYRGYFADWSPISADLDVPRTIAPTIMREAILVLDSERRVQQDLFVVKGHAGAGKSVLLRRLAWQASVDHGAVSLFVREPGLLEYEHVLELFLLLRKRLFLFIDPASDCRDLISHLLISARRDKLPLTIITAERHNEWDAACSHHLDRHVVQSYDLRYLSRAEIEKLVDLLDRHRALGHLERLSRLERIQAFEDRAGRQLLVALHETTMGKPLAEIVLDEYNSVPDPKAQVLYRTVCVLHRLGIPTRAGLIARVHGIPFTAFQERLFAPLKWIVFARRDETIRDYVYVTRHSRIAELVFEQVLVEEAPRVEEYVRIISKLDPGYRADADALLGLASAKGMRKLFGLAGGRAIFAAARKTAPQDHMLLQQEAIFEMKAAGGDLGRAAELLGEAKSAAPSNPVIVHSFAELALRRAKQSKNELERDKWLTEARNVSASLLRNGGEREHAYHTLLRCSLLQLGVALRENDEARVRIVTSEFQQLASRAKQECPKSPYLFDAEAQYLRVMKDTPGAIQALDRAFKSDVSNSYVAIRLARLYEATASLDSGVAVLRQCVEANPSDKDAQFELGLLMNATSETPTDEARLHHFRSGFTRGDKRYLAQFWYYRALYLHGDHDAALAGFRDLGGAVDVDSDTKLEPRGEVRGVLYHGTIVRLESYYAIVSIDGPRVSVFAHWSNSGASQWHRLTMNSRVAFKLAFNMRGPLALDVQTPGSSEG